MTEKEKCINSYILNQLVKVREDLYEVYDCLQSEFIYAQIDSLDELIKMLKAEPEKKERKHCYCKDCAYFFYSKCYNGPWRECTHSKYSRGSRAGEFRKVMKYTRECRDFIPAGENIEYHKGIKELLNNIQIKEREEEE